MDLPAEAAHPQLRRRPRSDASRRSNVVALCVGVLGLLAALALPFAPVINERTEVHWPATGEPTASTTAFLTPYRPASMHATVPCPVIRSGLDAPGPTTILRTAPPSSNHDGLALTAVENELHLLLGQREVPLPPLPADCRITVRADSSHTEVRLGRAEPVVLDEPAPEIFTFTTGLPPADAEGMKVTARPFSWFATSATAVKTALIATALLTAAVSLTLLIAHAPPNRALFRPAALLRRVRTNVPLLLLDAVMGLVFALWGIIGSLTDDDGFAMMTVRSYASGENIGNYYRWFDAAETPFTLVQHLMRWVSEYSLAPVWLRVPSVIIGFLTWLVVSRGIVAPMCRGTRRLPLHLITAVFLLACWMPYCVGIRPEPFVALGAAGVFAALLKATSSTTESPFGWLGVAALAAGLALAVTPTSLTVLFTTLVFLPRIWRLLSPRGQAPRPLAISARAALVLCLGSVGVVAMFADSTLTGVLRATAIHDQFGPSLGWYQELARYTALLSTGGWGSAAKRLAVLFVIIALLIACAALIRQVHRRTNQPRLGLLVGAVAGFFLTLCLTPSKWTHHFGALAGVGSALLAVTVVLLARVGKLPRARREARLFGLFGALGAAGAAALSFTGPNAWSSYSDWGMLWSSSPVRPGGLPLNSPLPWILLAGASGLVAYGLVRGRATATAREASKSRGVGWTTMPSSVLVTAALTSVVVLLGTFLLAPQRMSGSYSVGGSNWKSLTGEDCGIEEQVQVLPVASGDAPRPAEGTTELDGFAAGEDGLPGPRPPREPDLLRAADGSLRSESETPVAASPSVWGSFVGGPSALGSMSTRWFSLPRLTDDQVLSVWVAGRPERGNTLAFEFGTARGGGVRSLDRRALTDPEPMQRPYADPRQGRPGNWRDYSPWRLLEIEAEELPPGADRVRLRAEDGTTDPEGWLGFSGPVVRDVVGLDRMLAGHASALIDWPISFAFPCFSRYPRVGNGTAEGPELLVSPPRGEASMAFDPNVGGVFAGVPMTSRRFETPSRLKGAPGVTWGHVYSVSYGIKRDGYDVSRHRVRVSGAGGDGEYPFESD
ncbi:arabinosyltransferase C [Saccharopolyspora lacisalsi]|uniref:Arabinosyltransferase C n=1 Tax=Halosaccharopolyspora lacisalsi TaxID=1000566 RepID=A0A839E4H1_9PSEU|nr:arabinosyltransferase domain-containing protein [Halosaccharopolyspora lacisalsi]MBA8827486.1 arabinosyltransferase C [Halosaccharopolyspora lacisalsi]